MFLAEAGASGQKCCSRGTEQEILLKMSLTEALRARNVVKMFEDVSGRGARNASEDVSGRGTWGKKCFCRCLWQRHLEQEMLLNMSLAEAFAARSASDVFGKWFKMSLAEALRARNAFEDVSGRGAAWSPECF